MTLSTNHIDELSTNELLAAIASEDLTEIDMRTTSLSDGLKAAVYLTGLTRHPMPLRVRGSNRTETRSPRTLGDALLHAVVKNLPNKDSIDTTAVGIRGLSVSDNFIVAATDTLPYHDFEAFGRALVKMIGRSNIHIDSRLRPPLIYTMFEACSNAEEHGATIPTSSGRLVEREGLRFFAIAHHKVPRPRLGEDCSDFLEEFYSKSSEPDQGWLEVLVVDSGMGTAFPYHYVNAPSLGFEERNLYHLSFDTERMRLGLVLNKHGSTKGQWGRVLNRRTPKGYGIDTMTLRIAQVSGFTSLRTGRSFASWGFPEPNFDVTRYRERTGTGPMYDIDNQEQMLLEATVCHLLMPVKVQEELSL